MFHLPKPPASLRIVSRVAVPQELGTARDPRPLGVAVLRIIVRQDGRLRLVMADDPELADGFHAYEAACCHRWTDGDAALPATLWVGFTGPLELVVQVGCTTRYAADDAARRAA
jgi:hypothetical protein